MLSDVAVELNICKIRHALKLFKADICRTLQLSCRYQAGRYYLTVKFWLELLLLQGINLWNIAVVQTIETSFYSVINLPPITAAIIVKYCQKPIPTGTKCRAGRDYKSRGYHEISPIGRPIRVLLFRPTSILEPGDDRSRDRFWGKGVQLGLLIFNDRDNKNH